MVRHEVEPAVERISDAIDELAERFNPNGDYFAVSKPEEYAERLAQRSRKRCVWCWGLKRMDKFAKQGLKRLEVCLACEAADPMTAKQITPEVAKKLRRQMQVAKRAR